MIDTARSKIIVCSWFRDVLSKNSHNFPIIISTRNICSFAWNLSWWLLLPSFFIICRRVVLEICDSSFLEFSKSQPFASNVAKKSISKHNAFNLIKCSKKTFWNWWLLIRKRIKLSSKVLFKVRSLIKTLGSKIRHQFV